MKPIFFIGRGKDSLQIEEMLVHYLGQNGYVIRTMHHYYESSTPLRDWLMENLSAAGAVIAVVGEQTDVETALQIGIALGRGKKVLAFASEFQSTPLLLAGADILPLAEPTAILAYQARDWLLTNEVRPTPSPFSGLEELRRAADSDPTELDKVSPKEFEEMIRKWLEKQTGSPVNEGPAWGPDFELKIDRRRIAIEVKKHSGGVRVSVREVQQLVGMLSGSPVDTAYLISATGFTSSAKVFASEAKPRVKLVELEELKPGFSL